MATQQTKNMIVIGASAGGIVAVTKLVSGFTATLNAAVCIVIHVSGDSKVEVILKHIQKHTVLKCVLPKDNEPIVENTIYLAPANHHMIVADNMLLIRKGPYENHWRPAIDVLFRSAASHFGSCVTGIILTGLLDDGTSGMSSIKRSGGMLIVQDPAQAEFIDMPTNVLENVGVDHSLRIEDMPAVIAQHYAKIECDSKQVPEDVKLEAEITIRMNSDISNLKQLADPTSLTCPDCGGSLMKIKNEADPRYRCYTGHSFSELALEREQVRGIENSLWVAIRMMEERKNLLNRMTKYSNASKNERTTEITMHIERLKDMLLHLNSSYVDVQQPNDEKS
jgi:two-component system chemotaxis response regulator CheB